MERIAGYNDYRRAARAVQHLDDAGFDLRDVRIVARDLARRPVRSRGGFLPFARDGVLSAVASAALTVVVLVAFSRGWDIDVVAFALVAVGSIVAGLLVAALLHLRDGGAVSSRLVVPGGYDVECSQRAAEASHELARWWDTELKGKPQSPRGFVTA